MSIVKTNILVVGLLSTGSSALVDFLREYENIYVVPGEFNDFRAPGLVADQLGSQQSHDFKNHIKNLVKIKVKLHLIYNILPIFRFNKYSLKGIRDRLDYLLIRIRQLNLLNELNTKLTSNISFEDKIRYSNQWITDVGKINNKKKEYIVFNQPLLTINDTNIWGKVFYPWKLIVVYRDPKDQLAEIIKNGNLFAHYNAPHLNLGGVTVETIYGRSRRGAIKFHIDAIKKRFEWIDSLKKELEPDKFLLIDFEGLINKYDTYKVVIENFIGNLEPQQSKIKLYFNPTNASKSLNIYKEYLSSCEIESLKELENWYSNMVNCNCNLN